MKKKTLSLAALSLILAGAASAGEIHGTLTDNGKPVAA